MVPVMSEWILQKNSYVPAALNVRAPVSPLPRFSVVQAGSSLSVAVWGTLSLLVQAMTSPTAASMVDGAKMLPVMPAWTVPGSVEGAHALVPVSVAPAVAGGTDAAGSGGLTLAVPVVRTVRTRTDGPALNGALAGTGQLQLAFCVLLSAGLLAS